MLKNFIISFLGTALLIKSVPWSVELTVGARFAVEVGWTSTLIIFCLFCDKTAEKCQQYRARKNGGRGIMDRLASRGGCR